MQRISRGRRVRRAQASGELKAAVELRNSRLMDEPVIYLLDGCTPQAFGIELPERLLWEAYVERGSISREGEWSTGRVSEP